MNIFFLDLSPTTEVPKDTFVEAKVPRKRLKKVIVIASLIIAALVIFIVVLLVRSDSKNNEPINEKNKLCTTKACIKTGKPS